DDVRPDAAQGLHEAPLVARERRLDEDDVHLVEPIGEQPGWAVLGAARSGMRHAPEPRSAPMTSAGSVSVEASGARFRRRAVGGGESSPPWASDRDHTP